MNRKDIWKKQGSYRSLNTNEPMILVNNNGATVLEPLYKKVDAGQATINALRRATRGMIVNCPVCDKPFVNGTCNDCDKLVANL
jgi:hypothetical protein